jgi:hypothetical protein
MKKLIIFAILALMLIPTNALADGMILPHIPPYEPVEESQQVAAINYEGGLEKMIITVNFNMHNISEAVWIFPVPADPEKVVIDVVSEFPRFYGQDVIERTKSDIDNAILITQLTQIYPIFLYFFRAVTMYAGPLEQVETFGKGMTGVPSVTVYEHIEKKGMTLEIVTARTGEALYYYLNNRGYYLPKGSIEVLEEYVGKDYAFVLAWVSSPTLVYQDQEMPYWKISPYIRQPGVFVTFPTDEIYYPLMPTSVYGSKKIPIRIYLLGYVTPKLYREIETYTRTNYYVQDYTSQWGLEQFFGNKNTKQYTKVEIYSPSKYFSDDLWFSEESPTKVSYAYSIYSAVSEYPLVSIVLLILVISTIAGAVTGLIVFREMSKYALVGLANVFTIIGLAIAVAFTKTKRLDELLRRRLKQEGFMVITTDRKKIIFVILFSILFLVIGLIIGYLIKLPLMF